MYELTWDIPFLSYLTRNSPRSICYIRSLTETQSRSVTVACQTSNLKQNIIESTATTNPVYPLRSCRQDVATIYRSQTECTMSGNYLKESAVYQATVWGENYKGGFPLSRNFYVRTDVNLNWLYVRKLK